MDSKTVAVGDIIKFCRPPEISTWEVTRVDADYVMIKGWEDPFLTERMYTRLNLDVGAWSLVAHAVMITARDEATRKAAIKQVHYVLDKDGGKCPASCTPRNPCLGPICPGRRESGIGYEMWSKRQTGVNSQIEDYPVSEDQLRRYRNCGAVLMSRGELRCARDMACPLFRSK